MTISSFANRHRPDSWDGWGVPPGRAYREEKRDQARIRQERFDAQVSKVARDHNVSESEARRVVRARHRFEHKRELKAAATR